jgi:hypothetical protein
VTSTTPGTGSSITSMIVSSTGASTTWFSVFLEASVAATFGARCFFVMDLRATPPARRTFDFTFFAVARFAADLRSTTLAKAIPTAMAAATAGLPS